MSAAPEGPVAARLARIVGAVARWADERNALVVGGWGLFVASCGLSLGLAAPGPAGGEVTPAVAATPASSPAGPTPVRVATAPRPAAAPQAGPAWPSPPAGWEPPPVAGGPAFEDAPPVSGILDAKVIVYLGPDPLPEP